MPSVAVNFGLYSTNHEKVSSMIKFEERGNEETGGLDQLANEVVLVSLGDADVIDRTDLRLEIVRHVVDENIAVDVLGLALEAALEQQIGFL